MKYLITCIFYFQKLKKAFSPAYDWEPQENVEEWKVFKNQYESQSNGKYYVNSAFTIDGEPAKTYQLSF